MRLTSLLCITVILITGFNFVHTTMHSRFNKSDFVDDYLKQLLDFFSGILISNVRETDSCFVIITDNMHLALYDHTFFHSGISSVKPLKLHSYYMVADHFDITQTLNISFGETSRHQLYIKQCNLHFITIANGIQVKRLLHFIYRERSLNVQAKFVLLYDSRLLEQDMWPIWCNMLSTIFLQRTQDNSLRVFGIPFPNILNGIVVTKELLHWQKGKKLPSLAKLFPIRNTKNLNGMKIPVATYEHMPMVIRKNHNITNANDNNISYVGVEVEIIHALGAAFNFHPVFYTPSQNNTNQLSNNSYTSLLAELTNYAAVFAIGNLHPYELYRNIIDLSWPHRSECLTFLTPESSRDDSWRTLLQPFSISMWTGVLLSLLLVGTVFYSISFLNNRAQQQQQHHATKYNFFRRKRHRLSLVELQSSDYRDTKLRLFLNRLPTQLQTEKADLFDDYANCILLTYSMLLYVSLPSIPRSWPLRVLTGWFWIYCILVTVTYRASLTAILANPAARITIDSLQDLKRSHVTATVSAAEDKHFFLTAIDELTRTIGQRIEVIDNIYDVTERIAKENYAYYDNTYFLRHLRLHDDKHRDGEEVLHIMHECVVEMPVVIGMVKNTALKPQVDTVLHYLSESGLLNKWLSDVTQNLNAIEKPPQEAVMNLVKIWSSFVALAVGLLLAVCTVICERLHYRYIVCKHPLYDEYNRNFYYNFKFHVRNTAITQLNV